MEASQMFFNQSALFNSTDTKRKIYLFTPVGFPTKLVVVSLLATIGIVGFLGNLLTYYFFSTKKNTNSFTQTTPFVRNFNFYIKSLALSDILSNIISVPLACIQIMVDVFEHGWACRAVRFLGILFPSITMNNLMVISVERYLATRAVPLSFSVSTVRKLVFTAWFVGSILVLGPIAMFDGVRYDLNNTHYTVICKYDNSNFTSTIIVLCYTIVQSVMPAAIVIYINISLAKTLWTRQKRRLDIQRNNTIRTNLISIKLRGTYLLIAITFAFIIPYSVLPCYAAYKALAKPSTDFRTDCIAMYFSAGLFYLNSAINFIIYVVQMKDFRAFLKKQFCGKGNTINLNVPGEGIQVPNNR